MKTLLLLGAAAVLLLPVRGDILANGDFHNGKANWKGTLKAAGDSDTNDISSIDHPSDAKGVIVDLSKGLWPRIYQTFDSQDKSLNYTVTYQLSADYAPHTGGSGGMMPPQPPPPPPGSNRTGPPNFFLSNILDGPYSGALRPPTGNDFLLLVVDLTDGTYSSSLIHPTLGKTDAQTATGILSDVPPHDEKTFYLIFSGGKGSVTLLNVALTPTAKPQTDLDNGLH